MFESILVKLFTDENPLNCWGEKDEMTEYISYGDGHARRQFVEIVVKYI